MSYIYAQSTCKGQNGTVYTIRIIHDVAGTNLDTTFSLDASGFVMEYGGENDMYLVPGIMHSTCTINMLFEDHEFTALNTFISDMIDAEDGEFLLRVDSTIFNWIGVILPEHLRITEESHIRELRIKATDGLSLLKTVDYNNAGTAYTAYQTVYDILLEIQEKTATYAYTDSVLSANPRLAWAEDVVSTDDYTYTTHPPSTSFQGIKRTRINPANWINYEESGETYVSAYDVLVSLCNTFQWQLFAHAGGWWLLPIAVKDTLIYGNILLYNGSTVQTGIAGQYDYQTATKQKLPDWTIGYSPTVKRCRIERRTKESPALFRAINFADGTTLSASYIEFEGQDTASDTEFIRLGGKALIENTATAGLNNNERVARIVLRCEIKWDDGVDAEWYGNQILVDSGGAVITWLMQTLGVNVQNDLAVVTVLDGEASSTSTYFYYHIEEEQYLYDAGVAGSRYAYWSFNIPLPTTAKTGLSVTPEILIYDRNFDYDATFTAATTVTWQRFSASSYASDDELRLITDFDIVAETTTGRGEIDLGFTHIGGLASETGRIDVQVSAGVYGSSDAWVNNSSSSERQINKLLVEEVLALNKKSAYVERGTVYIQNGTLPFPYLRYYDNDNGRYYTALTWSWNAGEALLDLTLRNIGRNFEYITSDEQGGTRNPFLDNVVQNQGTKPGNVMQGYNAEAEAIFDAWTSGTVIGAGKTLEAYYTVTLNGNGKYVNFQGNTPADPNDVIERVIYVKSLGLADHTSTSGWTSPAGLQPTATSSAGPTIAECWQAINEYLTKFNGSQNNFTFLISYEELFFEGLLDDYSGAAAAYSLRRLDSGYTGDPIRVRRASDNTEADIPFTSTGDLDTDALAAHCGANNGYVKTWYDQSGNANDATQTTTANQPNIYYITYDNALLQSNNFSNATWEKFGITLTGGQAGYDGSNDAWKMEKTAESFRLIRQLLSVSGVWTISVYAKEGTGSVLTLRDNTNSYRVQFDLSGSGSIDAEVGNITSNIQSVGNGWFRCSATFDSNTANVGIYVGWNDSTASYIYIQDAQLETGDTLTDYVETTTTAATTGHVVTENGRPAMQFDGSSDYFLKGPKTTIDNTAIFSVIKSDSNTQDSVFINDVLTGTNLVSLGFGGFGSNNKIGSRLLVGGTTMSQVGNGTFTSTNQTLVSYLADNVTGQMFIDGTEETDVVGSRYSGQTSIGARGDGLYNFNGKMQEVIFYDSDETSNRTGIESNINDYYDIY